MNRYDTLKIGFPAELIGFEDLTPRERLRLFATTENDHSSDDGETENSERSTRYRLRPQIAKPIRGLNGIEVTTTPNRNSKAVIEFSSKSLGKDYYDGITKDNITTALQSVLPLGVECNCVKAVESASVFRCDVVMNIPTASVERSVLAMGTHPLQDNMKRTNYTRGRANGVDVVSTRESRKGLRLTAYDKMAEIARKRDNEELYRALGIDRFKGTIRIEAQYRKLHDIRNGLGFSKGAHPYLTDVLNSPNNALLYAMDNFYKPTSIADDYSPTPEGRASVIEEGYLAIFKRCNWDWSLCWAWVLSGYSVGANPTREKKYVRELFNRMNPNANTQTVTEYQRLRDEVVKGQG
jgi:hypothetical protein